MVSGKRESCDERGKREEEGGEGIVRRRRRRRSKREIAGAVPFAEGEEAAASTVLRGKRRSDKSPAEEDAAVAAAFRQGKRRSRGRCREGDSFTAAVRAQVRILRMPFSSGSIEPEIQIDSTRARRNLNQAGAWAAPG